MVARYGFDCFILRQLCGYYSIKDNINDIKIKF